MGFKSITDYNEQLYGGLFLLRDDGDYADVIFLYRSVNDVLIADTHYIKSADYSGYVHCCGNGCPACAKGIRVQQKLFIPLYNITAEEVQIWDRNARFQMQFYKDVLSKYPDPSKIVFRITRHGSSGDINTKYEISAILRNSKMPYDEILSSNGISMPEHYTTICREYTKPELSMLLNSSESFGEVDTSDLPEYNVKPRNVIGSQEDESSSFDEDIVMGDIPIPDSNDVDDDDGDDDDKVIF